MSVSSYAVLAVVSESSSPIVVSWPVNTEAATVPINDTSSPDAPLNMPGLIMYSRTTSKVGVPQVGQTPSRPATSFQRTGWLPFLQKAWMTERDSRDINSLHYPKESGLQFTDAA